MPANHPAQLSDEKRTKLEGYKTKERRRTEKD